MGLYNSGIQPDEMLVHCIGPFCKLTMKPENIQDLSESDSFEFRCENCNPNVVISLSGAIAGDMTNFLSKNKQKFGFYRTQIQKQSEGVFRVYTHMFN